MEISGIGLGRKKYLPFIMMASDLDLKIKYKLYPT